MQSNLGWLKLPLLLALLPVLLPCGWAWLQPRMDPTRSPLAVGSFVCVVICLLLAQLWLYRAQQHDQTAAQRRLGWLGWGAAFAAALWLALPAALLSCYLQALGLALLYQLHLAYQRQLQHSQIWRWWTLDHVLLGLLLVWTVSWALLLTSHAPGFAKQPIPLALDWPRIVSHSGEFFGYGWQFAVLASAMYGCYWLTRYLLIRRVLARYGLLPFILVSIGLIMATYAPLTALLLALPMNQGVEVPAVPGGSQDPYDWYNFNFMLLQWLLTTPLILAFERQQHDSRMAQLHHHQVQTELQLLQQQINPHFLFNTLNNLYALCLLKSDQAPALVLRLADLMRYVVYQGQQRWVSLAQDLTYLQHYLALQQLRYAHAKPVQLVIPPQAECYQLPPLLLIMLLENAYKHGVEPSGGAGELQLEVTITPQRLCFELRNTLPTTHPRTGDVGVGLTNLRRRLLLLFDKDFTLSSGPDGRGYWVACLQIPLQPLAAQGQ